MDVLKDFCTNMRKAYPSLIEKFEIEKYQWVINSSRVVELRDVGHGDNKCRKFIQRWQTIQGLHKLLFVS